MWNINSDRNLNCVTSRTTTRSVAITHSMHKKASVSSTRNYSVTDEGSSASTKIERLEYMDNVGDNRLQPKSSATQSTSSDELKYDLTKPAAVAIIHSSFKNDPKRIRKGSQHDYKLLMDFFNELNAKVICSHQDPKVRKVRTSMEKIKKKDFDAYSCLIIVIMSHGDIQNQICALDGNYNLDDDIVQSTTANKSLKVKPKIFIVQACKGPNMIEADCINTVPSPSDILICFSTYEGTYAFRDVDEGTYFIQTLIKMLKEKPEKSIMDIMPLMRSEFESKRIRQVPAETTTLTKLFFFRDLKKKPKPKKNPAKEK